MKILFIEADEYLDQHQEKFALQLVNDGNEVNQLTDCYNHLIELKILLTTWKPEVIIFQTTFNHSDKLKLFKPLYQYIDYNCELWALLHGSGEEIIKYIPKEYLNNFTIFDVWMAAYGEELLKNHWKKELFT